jgi:hypothetical protein
MNKLLFGLLLVATAFIFSTCKKDNSSQPSSVYPSYFKFQSTTNIDLKANNMVRVANGNFVSMFTFSSNFLVPIVNYQELEVNGQSTNPILHNKTLPTHLTPISGGGIVFDAKSGKLFSAFSNYDASISQFFLRIGFFNSKLDEMFFGEILNFKVDIYKLFIVDDALFIVGGQTINNNRNVFVRKYTTNLDFVWEKNYGGPADDMGIDGVKLCDGNIGILAHTYSYGAGDRDVWFLKINQNGDSLSSHMYGGAGYEEPQQIISDGNCNYYIAAHSSSFGHPEHNGYIVCVNDNGNIVWENNYGTAHHDGFNAIALLPNKKGLLAAGRSMSGMGGQEDIFVQAVDFSGNPLWSKIFGDAEKSENTVAVYTDDNFFYLLFNRTLGQQTEAVFVQDKLQ